MNLWSDMDYDMHPVPLDLDTADRLLAGGRLPAGLQGIMGGGGMPNLPPGAFGGRR